MQKIKMPVLLAGHTMTYECVLRPKSLQLSLKAEGLSSAQMVLDEESPDAQVGAWVKIFYPNGGSGVYTVKKVEINRITNERTVQMEHGFGTLQDAVAFAKLDPRSLGGDSNTVAVDTAIETLLSYQSTWELDECDFDEAQGWSFTNSAVYGALEQLTKSVANCQWEFDQSALPWKLSLKEIPSLPECEMRMTRNISTMKVSLDKNGMFTRVYPTGANDIHIGSVNEGCDYLEKNTEIWGVIESVITDSTIKKKDRLKAWAQTELDKSAEPIVTVTISGWDLSRATGEELDRLVIGRICRVPLPQYGTVLKERITELQWKNCIADPESVTVTLANSRKTIQGVMAKQGGGGGGGSKNGNQEHDCELGEHGEKIEEITGSVLWTQKEGITAACGELQVVTDPVTQKKTLTVLHGTDLRITQEGVNQRVIGANGVISAINQTAESVKIRASKINLEGYVTASELGVTDAKIENLKSGQTEASLLWATTLRCGTLRVGASTYGSASVTIDGESAGAVLSTTGNPISISHQYFTGCTASTSGSTVTLTFTRGVGDPITVNFNKAGEVESASLGAVTNVRSTSGGWIGDSSVTVYTSSGSVDLGAKTVNVDAAYSAGWNGATNQAARSGNVITLYKQGSTEYNRRWTATPGWSGTNPVDLVPGQVFTGAAGRYYLNGRISGNITWNYEEQ